MVAGVDSPMTRSQVAEPPAAAVSLRGRDRRPWGLASGNWAERKSIGGCARKEDLSRSPSRVCLWVATEELRKLL
jgi:hypothetical protein